MGVNNAGGPTPLAIDDKVANEILKTHLARLVSGTGSAVTLVSIKSISQKVVAGTLYEYVGKFKLGGKEVECHVSAWSRPWIEDANEKLKIKAECGEEKVATKGDEEEW